MYTIISNYTKPVIPSWAIALMSVAVLLPISLPNRISTLRYVSLLSLVGLVVCLFLLMFLETDDGDIEKKLNMLPPDVISFIMSLPLLAGNFDCHSNAIVHFQEFKRISKENTFPHFVFLVLVSFFIVFLFTSIFASISYTKIGSTIKHDAMLNFKLNNSAIALNVLFIFSIIVSYALFLHSMRISIHRTLFKDILRKNDVELEGRNNWIETTIIVLSTVSLAVISDELLYLGAVTWAIFGSLLVYILPTFFSLKEHVVKTLCLRSANIVILLYGLIISFMLGLSTSCV